MGRADDDEVQRRRGRTRPRAHAPTSMDSMYVPVEVTTSTSSRQSSAKMKMASLMAVMEDSDERKSKSKRVKVEESADWAPRNTPISISSLTTSNEPLDEQSRATVSSLFQNEMPPMIQSFNEEKRRESSCSGRIATNGESKDDANNGDASPATVRTMYDFYFPSGKLDANGGSSSSTGGSRSLKRKRRSGRRNDEGPATELDLLRFGVDAAKLVPQGLVDRVDVHISCAVLGKVVSNHVANWCNRSGFAPNFLQEITTLLVAYYPCNYPTLLDEVLVGFLLKRPEYIDLVLPAMLEKMGKTGESVSTIKYPVADALVRMCGVRMGPQDRERHELVCTSLLRCLLEHNGDRFVLSPWIAACAIQSSDNVLHFLWRVLLYRTLSGENKVSRDEEDLNWRIRDPTQQIVELLEEEGKLRVCRITCGFVKLLLTNEELQQKLVESQSYLISNCLERAFKHASTGWSSLLMTEWLERRRKQQADGKDAAGSIKDLLDFLARFTSKLSLKKPEWFVNHVVRFVLSPQCYAAEREVALHAIVRDYMPFVFGAVDSQWIEQTPMQNGCNEALVANTCVPTKDLDVVGSQSILSVQSKIELLVDLLAAVGAHSSIRFVKVWSEAWADKATTLCWGHVHALVCVTIQDLVNEQSVLGQKLQSFTTRVCRSYYRRLSHDLNHDHRHDEVATKFAEALNLLLPCTRPVAGILLQEVLGALAVLEKSPAFAAFTVFGNVVILHLGSCDDSGMDTSVKRRVIQKSRVDYGRLAHPATSSNSSTTIIHLLTMLKTLALTKSETGDFTRRVLSSARVVRLLAGLLNVGRQKRRQELLLDVMKTVVVNNTTATLNRDWARQNVVTELVHCAYTGPSNSAKGAVAVLESIFRHTTNSVQDLLWVILQQCTKLCCGHEENLSFDEPVFPPTNYQGRADTFAELVKTMVITVPARMVQEVLRFMEQNLASCSVEKTRMNLFLLLLLRKLVVCELQCGVFLPVVQLAVYPLASTDLDRIRLIQLQLLKALCTRLIAIRHRPVASTISSADADWKRCEDLVCNERLQSDLRSMVTVAAPRTGGSGGCVKGKRTPCCRVFEVLAQSILAFIRQLEQQSPIDEDRARRILKKSRVK